MGNTNNPMTEARQAEMNAAIQEFVTKFGTVFPNSYKDALIESIKEGAQNEEEDERKLPDCPTPDFEIKTGSIIKVCYFDNIVIWLMKYF